MKRLLAVVGFILLFAAVGGGAFWAMRMHLAPEIIEEPIFRPVEGAVKERVVMKVGELSSEYVSSSQPISTSVAEGHINVFLNAGEDGHDHADGNDFDVTTHESLAVAAKVYRFESPDLCKGDVCPMGLFAIAEGQNDELENPVLVLQARSIAFTDTLTNGNPDLIVDYGEPTGVRRLKWDVSGHFPMYMDVPVTE
jgi:hypothetical protein